MNVERVKKQSIPAMLVAALTAGCAGSQPPLETVDYVDIDRFMGDWYVIANIPTFLERGAHNAVESYRLDEDGTVATTRGWRSLAINAEFSARDKFLYLLTYGYNLAWVVVFVAATVFFLTRPIEGGDWSRFDALWLGFWHARQWIEMGISAVVIVWFTIGGVRDVKALLRTLEQRKRDEADDGFIPRR